MTMIDEALFTIPCPGDACEGDVILFSEAVFAGSFRKPRFLGDRRIAAKIIKDSYGAERQQHTFSLAILASDGTEPLAAGSKTTRKGRSVYRNGVLRAAWLDETERRAALDDKHARGDAARRAREERRGEGWQ